jgi:hypothetical protein
MNDDDLREFVRRGQAAQAAVDRLSWRTCSDDRRSALREMMPEALRAGHVPDHLRGGLLRYVEHGILPGGYLQAILCNDLREAVMRSASRSFDELQVVARFVDSYLSAIAGTRERVLAWTTTPERLEV